VASSAFLLKGLGDPTGRGSCEDSHACTAGRDVVAKTSPVAGKPARAEVMPGAAVLTLAVVPVPRLS